MSSDELKINLVVSAIPLVILRWVVFAPRPKRGAKENRYPVPILLTVNRND